jgi:hypothetical protein
MNDFRERRAIPAALLAMSEPLGPIRVQQREEERIRIPLNVPHHFAFVVHGPHSSYALSLMPNREP